MANLDEIDERLVRALQHDGRASYETLAQLVGLARSSTKARVQRLLGDGGLRLVGAIHPAVFGLSRLGHVTVETDGPAGPVADAVAGLDEISFVTTTAGRFALTAELRTGGQAEFAQVLARVQAVPGVRAVQTMTYLRIEKDPYFPPGPLESPLPLELDAADHALLEQLRVDGRASFAELASVSGLSSGATRTRVLRLLDARVVHVGALVRLNPLSRTYTLGFALHLAGETEPVARKVVALDEVDCFATGIGWCNGIGTVRASTLDDALSTLEHLRGLPGVRTVESWAHLRAIKEENHPALSVPRGGKRG